MAKEVDIKALVKKAGKVGNVYARWTYGIREISVTLERGVKLPVGDYIFVVDEDGFPIIYQVYFPHYYKPGFDFEEALITTGSPIKESGAVRYRCRATLLGKLNEDGEISPPTYPIPPMADVYRCPPEMVKLVTEPLSEWKIKLGVNPETGLPVYVDLKPLVRQSLLLTGAQGTGKTTALLTIIARAAMADPPLRFLLLDWSGEYMSLRDVKGLKKHVEVVPWDKFALGYLRDKGIGYIYMLLEEFPHIGKPVIDLLTAALSYCSKHVGFPTKGNVEKAIEEVRGRKWPTTVDEAKSVVKDSKYVPEEEPSQIYGAKELIELVNEHKIVLVNFAETKSDLVVDELEFKKDVAAFLAGCIWERARKDEEFGCIVVSDEAHRLCPEFERFDPIWHRLATEGGRNGCPFWLVARRLSIVSKKVTTEAQQNFICFNVEDVDRKRVEEDLGTSFAGLLGSLAQGEAMVKSMGFRVPGQVIHVKFDKVVEPASAKYGPEYKFAAMAGKLEE